MDLDLSEESKKYLEHWIFEKVVFPYMPKKKRIKDIMGM